MAEKSRRPDGQREVYIHGTAVSRSWADERRNLQELIFDATNEALAAADMSISDVHDVILSAHDLVDGRSLTNMVTAPAAGAYLKDELRLGDDGAVALILGAARVRSGASPVCLVAAWGRASEGDQNAIANALFDPFYSRPFGMTETAVSAMRAVSALGRYPQYDRWRDRASARRVRADNGVSPAATFPLRQTEMPIWSDVVAVAVLSATLGSVEVAGVGMSTEAFDPGDRSLVDLPALSKASAEALDMASTSMGSVDILELDGLTLFDEALSVEAVGACEKGAGMQFLAERENVNHDGGFAAGYCDPAMGLVRVCQAARRLTGQGSGVALACGSSVLAAQAQAAVVLTHA